MTAQYFLVAISLALLSACGGASQQPSNSTIAVSIQGRHYVSEGRFADYVASVPNATWLVDGLEGGSPESGYISRGGQYAAPMTSGQHQIQAQVQGVLSDPVSVEVVPMPVIILFSFIPQVL